LRATGFISSKSKKILRLEAEYVPGSMVSRNGSAFRLRNIWDLTLLRVGNRASVKYWRLCLTRPTARVLSSCTYKALASRLRKVRKRSIGQELSGNRNGNQGESLGHGSQGGWREESISGCGLARDHTPRPGLKQALFAAKGPHEEDRECRLHRYN
jgi:hypothetical protein